MATPAPSVDVGATQLGAATLSATSTSLAAGFAATQAELPPWLRRLATGTQAGGDAIFDAPANTLASKPARRHVGVESGIGIGSASFGVGLRDTRLHDASAGRDAMVAMAERRRRVERERTSARKRAVSLVRRYRAGELPDVRAATPAALLDPLVALARRDAATAAALLTSILDAALAADDAFQCSDRRGDGGKRTRADVPSTTHGPVDDGVRDAFAAGPLRRDVRAAVSALLPAASSDPSLAAWALETVAADPGASISNCAAVRARRRQYRVASPPASSRWNPARRTRSAFARSRRGRNERSNRHPAARNEDEPTEAKKTRASREGVRTPRTTTTTFLFRPRWRRFARLWRVYTARRATTNPRVCAWRTRRRKISGRDRRWRRSSKATLESRGTRMTDYSKTRARERFPRLRPVSNVCGAANAFDAANASATGRRCFTTSRTPSHRRGRWNPCLAAATEPGVTKSSRRTIASSRDRPWAAGSSRRRCAR